MQERRHIRRFNLKLPCIIKAVRRQADMAFEVMTRNISAGGAYINIAEPLPVGTHLTIEVMIRRKAGDASHSGCGCVKVGAEVLRTDALGMAVEFDDQYRIFQINDPGASGQHLEDTTNASDKTLCHCAD